MTVDKGIEQEHLAQAHRHIVRAEEMIREQHDLIKRMSKHGHDIKLAKDLLQTMQATLEHMYEHRDMIEAAIAGERN
jgi:hypothetical protein